MPEPISGTAIYLIPGQSVLIESSLQNRNDFGWFAAPVIPTGHFDDTTYVGTILRGFVVEDSRVGSIKANPTENSASIIYTHKRVAANAIWFFSVSGERGLVNVISVPIHDHSTIVHGGPAYGTYFDDDTER
jgi:hypothetical protein